MRTLLVIAWLLLSLPAWAHKPSDSYLSLAVQGDHIEGQWDIALRDLDNAIGLDSDGSGELTWGEVRDKHGEISAYALSHLALSAIEKRVRHRCWTNSLTITQMEPIQSCVSVPIAAR